MMMKMSFSSRSLISVEPRAAAKRSATALLNAQTKTPMEKTMNSKLRTTALWLLSRHDSGVMEYALSFYGHFGLKHGGFSLNDLLCGPDAVKAVNSIMKTKTVQNRKRVAHMLCSALCTVDAEMQKKHGPNAFTEARLEYLKTH